MAAKQKTDNTAYKKLKRDLADGTLGRLYVFHGEEAYLRDFYLSRMKEQLVSGGMGEFNFHRIEGKELTPQLLEQMVDALPMMSERTMVLVNDFDLFRAGERDREELIRILSQLPDYCCVVFVYDLISYKGDARTKLSAVLHEVGSVVEFARQEQGDLVDWVHRRFRALGKEIDTEQAQYLIFQCGDLMNALIGEIEKIGAYSKGQRITRADIDAVATPQLDAIVFQMTDAIGAGNFERAAAVLGELFQMQEPAIRILYSLGKHMRQLYCARLTLENRGTAGDLAKQWGLKPYPAQKLMDSARRFSLAWCRKAVIRCAQTDLALKSGGGSERELMAGLLLELATPAGKKA
ncbi:MAG: DNA polymerase III subunit delta [Oscillospiraceae bacterium]|nr:DNA polymerase III subunit delta [Oscillospiraceae bacterium]